MIIDKRKRKQGGDKMNDHFVITIGREAGSGGKIISQMLAERLGVKC